MEKETDDPRHRFCYFSRVVLGIARVGSIRCDVDEAYCSFSDLIATHVTVV